MPHFLTTFFSHLESKEGKEHGAAQTFACWVPVSRALGRGWSKWLLKDPDRLTEDVQWGAGAAGRAVPGAAGGSRGFWHRRCCCAVSAPWAVLGTCAAGPGGCSCQGSIASGLWDDPSLVSGEILGWDIFPGSPPLALPSRTLLWSPAERGSPPAAPIPPPRETCQTCLFQTCLFVTGAD